ncbi:MAG: MFS transporter [Acidobacteria bacterium]|nr:MFS transporter [Acidobacteriota bacterium]
MATETTALAPAARIQRTALLGLTLYSLGHFFVDLYSAALGVFQPLLIDKLHFTLAEAGVLGGVMSFSSSVTQPAWGYLADRFKTRLFSALGPAVAGLFIASLGWAPNYWTVALMVLAGGAGMASFHPQASSRATAGLPNRSRWMAVFISAGTLGVAAGPVYFSTLFRTMGLKGAAIGALPSVLATVLLVFLLSDGESGSEARRAPFDWRPLAAVWQPLTILYLLVFIRSVIQISFMQFLVLYLHRERAMPLEAASWALTAYVAAGALGGLAGGNLADRFGGKRIIQISMLGCLPFLALFYTTTGVVSIACLTLGGLLLLFTIPVNVVMAQELAPTQSGTVSALMMGFAWGMAGLIFIPLTGWIADRSSLGLALAAQTALPFLGFVLTFWLREKK